MSRFARVVAAGHPHHIIQRGNRRQNVFFCGTDYQEYLRILSAHSRRFCLKVICYCLMPNHVHLIVIPREKNNLVQAIGETHRNYTRYVNSREGWRGYLWQGRFSSYVLDERHLLAAVRYILLNPVKAGMVKQAWQYQWSSVNCHMGTDKNASVDDTPIKPLIRDWRSFLSKDISESEAALLSLHERTGRPLGDFRFIETLETLLKVRLKKYKPGPKKG